LAFKVITAAVSGDHVQRVVEIAKECGVSDVQVAEALDDGRRVVSLLTGDVDRQDLLDRLQGVLGQPDDWRIVIMPADSIIPSEPEPEPDPKLQAEEEEIAKAESARASREELYHLVTGGARLDSNFLLLVFLSTIVASIGLETDSVATLIGAMVIAPLLGPNLAFALGVAIGDRKLMLTAARTSIAGVLLSIALAAGMALAVQPNVLSHELTARTSLDYAGIGLALASGAAAALSVTTGLSSTLVGVMVAVALLPPAATLGIMAAAGKWSLAGGAMMLLLGNVACVNLAAQLVFLAKGIRPRTWTEKQNARVAVRVNLVAWIALILLLVGTIAVRQS
jgi:uncharacterized hydrophobic protein (TIGR00341 family)